jgi:hypothetical protein
MNDPKMGDGFVHSQQKGARGKTGGDRAGVVHFEGCGWVAAVGVGRGRGEEQGE